MPPTVALIAKWDKSSVTTRQTDKCSTMLSLTVSLLHTGDTYTYILIKPQSRQSTCYFDEVDLDHWPCDLWPWTTYNVPAKFESDLAKRFLVSGHTKNEFRFYLLYYWAVAWKNLQLGLMS